jgi:hypothetical protein
MQLSFRLSIFTTSLVALATVATLSQTTLAEDQPLSEHPKFECIPNSGIPSSSHTTIARTAWNDDAVPIIRWVSNSFKKSGYSQEKRCKEVTEKLNRYYLCGLLEENRVESVDDLSKLVALPLKDYFKKYPAIVSKVDTDLLSTDGCANISKEILAGTKDKVLLFMLERGDDPKRVLEQINSIRKGDEEPVCDSPESTDGTCNQRE